MLKTKLARRSAYATFAFITFVLFVYAGFPTDAVVGRIVSEVARQSKGAVQLKVGHASLWRGTGIALKDVHVIRQGSAPLGLEAVKVRLRLLPLLIFRRSITVQLPLGRGLFWSTVTGRGDGMDVHVEGSELDFTAMPIVSRTLGVPLAGVFSLEGDLTAVQDLQHATGNLALTLDHMAMGPGPVYGLAVPKLDLGKLELAMKLQDGHAKLQKFVQTGGTVNLQIQGGVELATPMVRSTLDLCSKVRLDPVFLEKNPKMRSVMQLAEVQLRRDPDGFLNAPLVGPITAPQLRPGLCPKR
jgi:type II secretion system protein N